MDSELKAEEYLVNEKRAAKLLGFTQRFLQSRRLTGDGPPYVRISQRAIRYRLSDLREWVEVRIMRSTSEGIRKK